MHDSNNSGTGVLISFKLMRPGWIPATPLRNAGKGKRLLVYYPANTANVLLSSIVVNLGDSSVRTKGRRPVIIFMVRVK